jgi:hypothetical protein
MNLPFTQNGSLLYRNPDLAVEYSLRHGIPFLPELTKLREDIDYLKESRNVGKMSCLKKFKEYEYDIVKVQCIGPGTLTTRGVEENESMLRTTEHAKNILYGLNAREIIFFIDDPAFGYADFDFENLWKHFIEEIKSELKVPYHIGVHCCKAANWDIIFKSNFIDILSTNTSLCNITEYSEYRQYRKRGGKISWGIEKESDVIDWKAGDLITAPCGLGTDEYSIEDYERILKFLENTSKKLLERH